MKGINWKSMRRSNLGSILMIVFGAVLVMNPTAHRRWFLQFWAGACSWWA